MTAVAFSDILGFGLGLEGCGLGLGLEGHGLGLGLGLGLEGHGLGLGLGVMALLTSLAPSQWRRVIFRRLGFQNP